MGTTGVPRRHAIWHVPLVLIVLALLGYWIGTQLSKWPPPPPHTSPQHDTTHQVRGTSAHVRPAAHQVRPSVLVLGDSYASGWGATSPDRGWVAILGDALGWRVENLARKGAAYTATSAEDGCVHDAGCEAFATVVAEAGTAEPDLVLVTGGRKDVTTADGITAARSLLTDLAARYPDTDVVVVPPLWDDAPLPEAAEVFASALQDATASVGGTFLDVGQPLSGHPELIVDGSAGTLPNDAGHEAIAQAVEQALLSSGLIATP